MTPARTSKTTTKKAPARSSARKSSAKKAPARKSPAKSSSKSSAKQNDDSTSQPSKRAAAPKAESRPKRSAMAVAARAIDQLAQLTGREAEGVTGVERLDDGWRVTVEVVEVRRVPQTTDVLAQYEVDTDADGELQGYRRTDRYTRGSTREE